MATNKSTIIIRQAKNNTNRTNLQQVTDNSNLRIFKLRQISAMDEDNQPVYKETEDSSDYIYYSGNDIEKKLYDIDQRLPVETPNNKEGKPAIIAKNLHANENIPNTLVSAKDGSDSLVINKGYTDKFFVPFTGTPSRVTVSASTGTVNSTASVEAFNPNKVLTGDLYKVGSSTGTTTGTTSDSDVDFKDLTETEQEKVLTLLTDTDKLFYENNIEGIKNGTTVFKVKISTGSSTAYKYDRVLTAADIKSFDNLKNISTNKDFADRTIKANKSPRTIIGYTIGNVTVSNKSLSLPETVSSTDVDGTAGSWPVTLSGYGITDAFVAGSKTSDNGTITESSAVNLGPTSTTTTLTTNTTSNSSSVTISLNTNGKDAAETSSHAASVSLSKNNGSITADVNGVSANITLGGNGAADNTSISLSVAGLTKTISLSKTISSSETDGTTYSSTINFNDNTTTTIGLTQRGKSSNNSVSSRISLDNKYSELTISGNKGSFDLTLANNGTASKSISAGLTMPNTANNYANLSLNGLTASFAKIANTGSLADITDKADADTFGKLEQTLTGSTFSDVSITDNKGKQEIIIGNNRRASFEKIAKTGALDDITDKSDRFYDLETHVTSNGSFSDITMSDFTGNQNTNKQGAEISFGSKHSLKFDKVATSGNYQDLSSQPVLTLNETNSRAWAELSGLKTGADDSTTFSGTLSLARLANTAAYKDLRKLPPQLDLTTAGLGSLTTISLGIPTTVGSSKYYPNATLVKYTFSAVDGQITDVTSASTEDISFINLLTSDPDNNLLSIIPLAIDSKKFDKIYEAEPDSFTASDDDNTTFSGGYQGQASIALNDNAVTALRKIIEPKNKIIAVRLEKAETANAVDASEQMAASSKPYILLNVSSTKNNLTQASDTKTQLTIRISCTGYSINKDIRYDAVIELTSIVDSTDKNNVQVTNSGTITIYWRKATDSNYTMPKKLYKTVGDLESGQKYENVPVSIILDKILFPFVAPEIISVSSNEPSGVYEDGQSITVSSVAIKFKTGSTKVTGIDITRDKDNNNDSISWHKDMNNEKHDACTDISETLSLSTPLTISTDAEGFNYSVSYTDKQGVAATKSGTTAGFTFKDKVYWGPAPASSITDSASILKLKSKLAANVADIGDVSQELPNGQYLFIACNSSWAAPIYKTPQGLENAVKVGDVDFTNTFGKTKPFTIYRNSQPGVILDASIICRNSQPDVSLDASIATA